MASHSTLLQKLKNGHNVYGTCITSTAPMWPVTLQRAGLDFVFLDTEHIPLDRAELARLCQIFRAYHITPIVRIPKPDPYLACQVIDGGAVGVIAPYLESVDQIIDLVGATKYRPLKGERLARFLSGKEQMPDDLKQYIEAHNAGNICIANIESVPALERLDSLLSVPGLDAVFIGPHDLSVSLGIPEQYDHPDFEAAVLKIIQTTRNKGLSIGIHFSQSPERQVHWVKQGVNIIVHSFDVALFGQRLRHDIGSIKKAVGDDATTEDGSSLVI
ncbi:HpcH/HpaI aldolase family protein [Larkinella punicea]|uniref:Aldolase n=1 Tax=Larkinella punicea TaxID=2315727 RepID=A0A368JKZ9_9BACT|nr:aldolase/citrate lyase family protein [Larkinella punicea]RCR67726.1 aldolase [Larkinella punicea]